MNTELKINEISYNMIVACDQKDGIGKNGGIPWFFEEDLKEFKNRTANKIVIMGRKTWDSIFVRNSKPLPLR